MSFFDRVRKLLRDFREDIANERVKRQVRALEESKPTDQFVTMTITGDGELEKMTRAGWDLVVKVEASEQAFLNQYLVRMRREDLARSLGLETGPHRSQP